MLVVSAERAGELDAIRAAAPEVSTVVVDRVAGVGRPRRRRHRRRRSVVDLGRVAGLLAVHVGIDGPARSWRCTATSTCGSPPTRTAPRCSGSAPDDRCYSVGPMFHAYGLGNSLTFPFSVGATAIVEPTRPPTPALVGEIASVAAADVAVLHPDVLRRPVRVGPAGRHVRFGALGRVGRRAAAGRDVPPLRGALRCAHPRRHRVHRDDSHLHLQQPDGPASGNVGPAGAGVPRRDRRRRRRTGSGGRARPPQGERRLDGDRLLVRQRRDALQLRRRAAAHRRHVLVLRRTATTRTSVAATT